MHKQGLVICKKVAFLAILSNNEIYSQQTLNRRKRLLKRIDKRHTATPFRHYRRLWGTKSPSSLGRFLHAPLTLLLKTPQ